MNEKRKLHEFEIDGMKIVSDISKEDYILSCQQHLIRRDNIFSKNWDLPTPIMEVMAGDEVESKIICNIGNWWISTEGDIYFIKRKEWIKEEGNITRMAFEGCYCIYSDQLKENDWILHLTEKSWFSEDVFEDFKRAYFIACKIKGIEPTKQIREYK